MIAGGATDESEIDMIHIPGAQMMMRVAPGSSMRLVDLRQLSVHQLGSLLDEEAALWRTELHWDYQFSTELIKKFLDTHSLAGVATLEDERPVGYGFYVVEEHKGMLGGLFVSPKYAQTGVGEQILGDIVQTLRGTPQVTRIEVQLMPFGASLEGLLAKNDFRLFPRHFMLYELGAHAANTAMAAPGLRMERWHERHMAASAELIHLTYANHIDGAINDQYRSRAGAMKFLKNIVILPGCGQFEARASFVLRDKLSDQLVGVVLTSMVAPRVGHTTQLCVLPGHQGHGLGRRLMLAAMDALKEQRAGELSLTVTSSNERAVKLYEELGFQKLKTFVAGVWSL
jgi:ribosomal protein S18 acetylase RimI-like enzyme